METLDQLAKKAAKFIGDLIFQVATPRGSLKYHWLSEAITYRWKGFEALPPNPD